VTAEPDRTGPRAGLRRLSTGLIGYGLVGVVIAVVGLIAVVWLSGRIGGLSDRTATQLSTIVDTIDETSTALSDAGASATSFSTTLDRTVPAVRQVAAAIGNLRSVEDQLGRVQILGNRPFDTVASQFGQMASDLEGLDTQLGQIADDLDGNRAALTANARSLAAIGERLGGIGEDLGSGVVGERLDDLQTVVTLLSLLLVVAVAFPAIGALWLGWSLRRTIGSD
jgi:Kef-type K+ transport system membrane component KefB